MTPDKQIQRDDHLQYLLTAYLFGDLSDAGVKEVEGHLKECAHCREELEELRETLSLTQEAIHAEKKDYAFDDRRRARVLVAARTARFGFLSKMGMADLPRLRWSFTAVAALLLVLVTGGLFLSVSSMSCGRRSAPRSNMAMDQCRTESLTAAAPPARKSYSYDSAGAEDEALSPVEHAVVVHE